MTDLMVQIPADWLARVFLWLRRSTSGDAHALAAELRPFTEKPGQRVPVPRATILRTELALRGGLQKEERRKENEDERRRRLAAEAAYLINARPGR